MPSALRSLTLLLLASLTLSLTGCGREYVAQPAGQTGISLGGDRFMFPGKDGEPTIGTLKMPAGVLVRFPKSEDEVISTLRAAGMKFRDDPPK